MREPVNPAPATPPGMRADGRPAPDYRPRNRLDPRYRPGAGILYRNRPCCEIEPQPWAQAGRRNAARRSAPWQRGLAWTLWLAALGAAAYGGFSLSRDGQDKDMLALSRPAREEARAPAARAAVAPEPTPRLVADEPADRAAPARELAGPEPAAADAELAGAAARPAPAAGAAVSLAASLALESELPQAPAARGDAPSAPAPPACSAALIAMQLCQGR